MASGSRTSAPPEPGAEAGRRIRVQVGDIFRLEVDAIVCSAGPALEARGGVAAAIHRTAGPKLAEECRAIRDCPIGEARLTGGYDLPARWVIHTAVPSRAGGETAGPGRAAQWAACHTESLRLAARNEQRSLAFPVLDGGAGLPLETAAGVAVRSVAAWVVAHALPVQVVFCCETEAEAEAYSRAVEGLSAATRGT